MPLGGGGHGKCTLSTLLLQSLMPLGGGSWKVYSEHIIATKVLMPVWGGVQESAL